MRTLSIKQPWAWAIMHGKDIENRTWYTRSLGHILIHASKKFDHYGYQWLLDHRTLLTAEIPHSDDFPVGGVVGISKIVDCVSYHPSPFFFGPWGFVLEDSRPYDFYPSRGRLGFFNMTKEDAHWQ